MINNNMSLDDIHGVTASISNSLWTLRKNGELNHLSEDEFRKMYNKACTLDNDVAWAILYRPKKVN